MSASPTPVLLLGGTGDANALGLALIERFGDSITLTTSIAGRTAEPAPVAGLARVGGFGGVDGLVAYLRETGTAIVIDATHPFAAQISRNAMAACAGLGIPLLRLEREAWQRQPGDRWIEVASMTEAARVLAPLARRIWLTTGTADLSALGDLADAWFLIRLITMPQQPLPLPLARYHILQARGPFDIARERALIAQYRIDALLTKASGGSATAAKLTAAREAGIPVVMIARPALPDATCVTGTWAALDQVARMLERRR
jgi:precorrin-6A/cobalt-precorrin-6A reductase